jgi:hypothetical protein
MSEFSPGDGFGIPKDEDVQAEHQHDIREEVEHSRAATEAARHSKAARRRPWWAFWRPRRSAR